MFELHKLLVLGLFVNSILCANILFMSGVPSRSHHIWNKILAIELVHKGHNVTMMTAENEKSTQNFTTIHMEGIYEADIDGFDMEEFAAASTLKTIHLMYKISKIISEMEYQTNGVKTLLNYPDDSFDLFIYDITFGRLMLGLVEKFNNIPVVAVTPFLLPPSAATMFGSPIYTSYMPFYCTEYTHIMSLNERLFNFIFTYADVFYFKYIFGPQEEMSIKKIFPENTVTLSDAARKISILLTNTDPVLEYPLPLPPNVIAVGGLHARPSQPLPKDLEKMINEAENGVIVFSLGTNVRSDELPKATHKALLKAFSKIPQIVFWKFESDEIGDVPKNVIIRKWLPQNDLLGHPKTVLLINHGGGLSTQEAIFHGVPLISIPFVADQYTNVRRIVAKNIALFLDKDELTFENIYDKITTILNNPMYLKNMKALSQKFRSQPQTPLEKAVFWINYILEHGNADHLSIRGRDLTFIELANLDVLFIILGGLLIISFVVIKSLFKVYSLVKPNKELNKIKTN